MFFRVPKTVDLIMFYVNVIFISLMPKVLISKTSHADCFNCREIEWREGDLRVGATQGVSKFTLGLLF